MMGASGASEVEVVESSQETERGAESCHATDEDVLKKRAN